MTVKISGDWNVDKHGEFFEVYEGEVTRVTPNGFIEWRADLGTVMRLIVRQDEVIEECGDDAATLELLDDGTLLVTSDRGTEWEEEERIRPDEDGMYAVGFGWTWYEI